MVRNYTRKTNRALISEDAVRAALQDIHNGNMSFRVAAAHHGVNRSTLYKRLKNLREHHPDLPDIGPSTSTHGRSKYGHQQVFSVEEEAMLEEYLVQSSKLQYGLTYKQVRDLAYDYAIKLQCKFPNRWETEKTAGLDWMKGFMKRHQRLSLRKPENTSIARNLNFNQHNVDLFFNNLELVKGKYNFPPDRILNIDESGLTTVLEAPKVIAPTGVKQIGQTVSAERGELVTICGIVSAAGNVIPPLYIFPRVHMKSSFLVGAPNGSVGFSSRSGWMTQEVFFEVIKHVAQHKLPTRENPILIVMDNHESHISLDTIIYCKENGIVLLTFPPHTSHRLQPLDVAVFAPFKAACKSSFNRWISSNPGKSVTIYNIAHLSCAPFDEAFSRKNIMSGFKKTGIEPFNRAVFTTDDFAPSSVTDHPQRNTDTYTPESAALPSGSRPTCSNEESISRPGTSKPTSANSDVPSEVRPIDSVQWTLSQPSTSKDERAFLDLHIPIKDKTPNKFPMKTLAKDRPIISPDQVRPFPKSEPSKPNNKGRKKGKSCVLTDTPEKNRIEEEFKAKLLKKEELKAKLLKKEELKAKLALLKKETKQCKRKIDLGLGLPVQKCLKNNRTKKMARLKGLKDSNESDSEEVDDAKLCDDGGLSPYYITSSSDSEADLDGEKVECDGGNININDFVLVKLAGKKAIQHFVAQITEKIGMTEFTGYFLKKKDETCYKFVKPEVVKMYSIDVSDITVKLPQPVVVGGTERAISVFNFKFNFSEFIMG